ncbi:hypothetical protein HRR83_002763 [Exophiala dermatitidis]|nr:hypothetical protein HRR76_005540 [Exophiala dermatitidis]KAJ4572670.1 hypothetical protein HRR81_005110 [Exophiala dermatitidis]KAJ4583320.1 hypothetical protein HRR82_003619 [Exophiala dermatitidis]KAJ4601565.1 hypothetical protein HRR83_002763 [Exophiala dermatitidis]KAJ4603801.1 hypothetical protein HRR85_008361 [Exophiala dermatitidis]
MPYRFALKALLNPSVFQMPDKATSDRALDEEVSKHRSFDHFFETTLYLEAANFIFYRPDDPQFLTLLLTTEQFWWMLICCWCCDRKSDDEKAYEHEHHHDGATTFEEGNTITTGTGPSIIAQEPGKVEIPRLFHGPAP